MFLVLFLSGLFRISQYISFSGQAHFFKKSDTTLNILKWISVHLCQIKIKYVIRYGTCPFHLSTSIRGF